MKKVLAAFAAMLLSFSINASTIEFGEGLILQTGSVFFNTVGDAETSTEESPVVSQGVGQITAIYEGSNTIWSSGTNGVEYNFVFDNIILAAVDGPNIFGSISYGDIFGEVTFFSNSIGTFSPTGDFYADSALIDNGNPVLYGIGHPVNGFTVVGSADDDSNGGQGQLSILGGSYFDLIVQDQLIRTDGSFADMTFNFSADNIQTAGYDWSGSADFATVSQVPLPGSVFLFGSGLLGLLGFSRFTSS